MGIRRGGLGPGPRARHERRLLPAHAPRRHDPVEPGGRGAPEPDPPAAPPAERRRLRLRRADRVRAPPGGDPRPLPHVGAAGLVVREGLPVHAARARLAGPRDGARHAVRPPRHPRLQPGAAAPLLGLHPGAHPAARLLQRVGDRRPAAPRRAAARGPLPRGADRRRIASRGRRRRPGPRVRSGRGPGVAAEGLGRAQLPHGPHGDRHPAHDPPPDLRSSPARRRGVLPRHRTDSRRRTRRGHVP